MEYAIVYYSNLNGPQNADENEFEEVYRLNDIRRKTSQQSNYTEMIVHKLDDENMIVLWNVLGRRIPLAIQLDTANYDHYAVFSELQCDCEFTNILNEFGKHTVRIKHTNTFNLDFESSKPVRSWIYE